MTPATAPRFCEEAIPAELRALDRWTAFQVLRQTGGSTKKKPWVAGLTKTPAAIDDPRSWRPFAKAVHDATLKRLYIGFAFDRTIDFVFIDIDDAVTPEGVLRPDAEQLVARLNTYTEVSLSGSGLHLIGRGHLPERFTAPAVPPGCHPIEAYPKVGGRFGILTGRVLPGYTEVRDVGEAVREVFPERVPTTRARTAGTRSGRNGHTPAADQPQAEAPDAEPPAGLAEAEGLTSAECAAIVAWATPLWTPGRRHAMALHLSGYLGKRGVPRAQAEDIVARCAVGDDDFGTRVRACSDTFDALEAGEAVSGFHGLLGACGLTEEEIAPLSTMLDALWRRAHPGARGPAAEGEDAAPRLSPDDFVAHLEVHKYLFRPTGKLWPRSGVNAAVPPVCAGVDAKGSPLWKPASDWLDEHNPVHQVTWAPGDPEIIADRLLVQGGWREQPGTRSYNLYRPPTMVLGDPGQAGRWVEHMRRLYPEQADHLIAWFAHRVQRPDVKTNHALLLGGTQGCGKDTALKPLREAVGPWNYANASPSQVVGRFNGFLRSVVLLVPELCDLGDVSRFAFYEHMKALIAAPPVTLRCDEKHLPETEVLNVCGVVFTSNQRIGIYLPPGDRRHFAAWSDLDPATLPAGYFDALHHWLEREGGNAHVAAYLHAVDLTGFNPNAPPPKTAWFWDIVDASRAPEESELSTLLDFIAGSPGELAWPEAITLAHLIAAERKRSGRSMGDDDRNTFATWLEDRKNRRQIPHRMEAVGYVPVRNEGAKDGHWKVSGSRVAVYARRELERRDQLAAVNRLIAEGT